MDDLDVAGDNPPSTSANQSNGHSGITLVLPSLRALKAANAGKKSKSSKQATADFDQRLKVPRPIKLKPLKEVLTKLIIQIKKKDDYAFFINPVDLVQVPGYTEMIKNPMDFGTMTSKVTKGKYRSLEEFATDFRLVTTNAKMFNPPGSIYHTEADRLETWGLEHISRASAHVIEYETDWNIDVEQDEDGSTSQQPLNVEDDVSTPRDFDGSMATGSPAPSMTTTQGQVGQGKRGPRGPYKKQGQAPLSDGLDAEGRMPGAKDGVGAFPPGSDWAELMIALKIKGKRYKTKKERLRFEKEGPPYQPDGSIDYAEMEDPFSVLNVLVPDPPARPQVTPLYPLSITTPMPAANSADDNPPQSQMSQPPTHALMPVTIPSDRFPPVLSTIPNVSTNVLPASSTFALAPPRKRRHWTIVRNVSARSRAKEKEGDAVADDTKTNLKISRDAGPADYGTFATLLGDLAASAVGPNTGTPVGSATVGAVEYMYGSEHLLYATIRSTIEHRYLKRKREVESDGEDDKNDQEGTETFFTDDRAEDAWDYLRNVVYGGVDGYAYVRSLAEFVAPSIYLDSIRDAEGRDSHNEEDKDKNENEKTLPGDHVAELPLGVPLPRYVEDNLVDAVTRGKHGWLRDVFLPGAAAILDSSYPTPLCGDETTSPFHARLGALPGAIRAMESFKAWSEEPLDMAALIRKPEELAKESMLEEGPVDGGERAKIAHALACSVEMIEELRKRMKRSGESENRARIGGVKVMVKEEEEEEHVKVEQEVEEGKGANANAMDVDTKPEPKGDDGRSQSTEPKVGLDADGEEDPLVKRLRMNLLALAKRAPLDRIAKLPVELVPEDIRGIVPIAQ